MIFILWMEDMLYANVMKYDIIIYWLSQSWHRPFNYLLNFSHVLYWYWVSTKKIFPQNEHFIMPVIYYPTLLDTHVQIESCGKECSLLHSSLLLKTPRQAISVFHFPGGCQHPLDYGCISTLFPRSQSSYLLKTFFWWHVHPPWLMSKVSPECCSP